MSTAENSRPRPAGKAPVIRDNSFRVGSAGVSLLLVIPAALISVLFNGGVIFGLYLLSAPEDKKGPQLEAADPKTEAVVQTEAPPEPEPETKDPLTITDVDPAAAEPDTNINFAKMERKDDVAVPGVVNPDEPVGVVNGSKENPPTSLPAPYGLGTGQGGAGIGELPTTGTSVGMPGGYTLRGMPLAGTFFGRSGATKDKALRDGGGTKESEAAVALGLQWIVRQQVRTPGESHGSFPLDGGRFKDRGQSNDIAGTAFGLLPLLGAGYTHKAAKNSKENPFDKPIGWALMFLMRKQDKKTGNFGGGMYAHALATIAICEAYGLSQDPVLRVPAQKAVWYLVKAQHSAGGWRYSPNEPGDTSVVGWVVMALKSAQMANLDVPESTMKKAVVYLNSVCHDQEKFGAAATEGYGYTGPAPTPTMSAVGLLCRQYLQNWGSQNLRMIKGVEKNIETSPPSPASKNIYYYYYATQVMHHFGGKSWQKWNEQMREVLIKSQTKNPVAGSDVQGSWSSAGDGHGGAGGRLMITSLSLLTLEVYYRHLPLYYRDMGEKRLASN
jgi:hypothetical protein